MGGLCAGCGTLPSGRGWGEDATISPGWARTKAAAASAARDPWVWGPLTAAAVLQIDGFDRRTSDWARDHTPVFGSQRSAEDWSDNLRSASVVLGMVSLLATPSGDRPGEWLINKTKGAAVEAVAISATSAATVALKDATQRERPNGADRESFPSGHASAAAVHGELAKRNLEAIDMAPAARCMADIGIDVVVAGTAWARVEAGWHYPSDTLVGMALGTFLGSFLTRALLPDAAGNSLTVAATDGGALLQWRVSFE
ncbi:MAG TPA: phosphatase PAP2 family protein [Steroidobacteraceae bacterium]